MKMMKLLVALLVMAGLVAPAIAVAEDKLSISGEFRVFGFSKENYSDFDDDNDADDVDFFSQRLRLYSKYAVAEGVTIHTRMDFGEEAWGNEGQNSVRFDESDTEWQLDRAFLEVDKPYFNLRAGQQYYSFGNAIAIDHQGTGFRVSTKGPVVVTAFWNKLDEGDSLSDEGDVNEDRDMYGASVLYKNDAFAAELFYALDDNSATDEDKSVIGLAASTKLGAVNLKGELNVFDGDNGLDGLLAVDYTGFQVYLDANTAVSSALTLGGSIFYAQGDDEDVVLTELSDFGSWLPWEYGYMETDFGLYNNAFDPFGLNAGAISIMGYGEFKANDKLGFKASIQYGMEEEDAIWEYDYMSYNLSANYMLAKNTAVFLQANYLDADFEFMGFDPDADEAMGVAGGIRANF